MRERLPICVVLFVTLSTSAQTPLDAWRTLKQLGQAAFEEGKYAAAEDEFQKALRVIEQDPSSQQSVTISLCDLAEIYRLTGRFEAAEALLRRALPRAEKYATEDPSVLAITLNNLALLRMAQGKLTEAESLASRSLQIQEKSLGPESQYVQGTRTNLASIYEREGRHDDAEDLLLRNLASGEKNFGPDSREVAFVLNNLATIKANHGQEQAAEPLFQRALPLFRKGWGPEHPYTVSILNNLGAVYVAIGQPEKGEDFFKEALAIEERNPEGVALAVTLNDLAVLDMQRHRYVAADPMLHRALSLRERFQGPAHSAVAATLIDLGRLNLETDHVNEAAAFLTRAEGIAERIEPPDNRLLHKLYAQLGSLYSKRGDLKGSRKLFEKALGSARAFFGNQHSEVAVALWDLGAVNKAQHRFREAEELYLQAIQLLDNAHLSKQVAAVRHDYAELLREIHRDAEAERLEQQSRGQ